jgi:hypothetical protein
VHDRLVACTTRESFLFPFNNLQSSEAGSVVNDPLSRSILGKESGGFDDFFEITRILKKNTKAMNDCIKNIGHFIASREHSILPSRVSVFDRTIVGRMIISTPGNHSPGNHSVR